MLRIQANITRILVLLLAVIVIFCSIPDENAEAYATMGYKLDTSGSTLLFIPTNAFGSTTIAHLNEALWQINSCIGLTLMRRSPDITHSSINLSGYSDGNNYIYKVNAGSSYIVTSHIYYNFLTGLVVEADINLNPYYTFANSAGVGCYDTWSVFLHEACHVAGLGHSSFKTVMYEFGYTNSIEYRYLKQDDKSGLRTIYS